MGWQEDLRTRLIEDAAIATLIGTRVAWIEGPREGGRPWLVLTIAGVRRGWSHSGPTGFDYHRIQGDAQSADAEQALAIADAFQAVMETSAVVGGTRFHPAQLQMELSAAEDLNGTKIFREMRDFGVEHQPTS